jgi:hypothetical protein
MTGVALGSQGRSVDQTTGYIERGQEAVVVHSGRTPLGGDRGCVRTIMLLENTPEGARCVLTVWSARCLNF